PETLRRGHESALDGRRLLRDDAPERVPEAVAAREAHDRALAVGADLDQMDLDVEVLDLREVLAQRARLLVGRHLAEAAERVDVVRAPGGGVAIEEAADPLLVGARRRRRHARLRLVLGC